MSDLSRRLRKLTHGSSKTSCKTCSQPPKGYVVCWLEDIEPEPPATFCPECGRERLIEVGWGDPEE
jgi:hypothetical protein